jgi:hypothetical protein
MHSSVAALVGSGAGDSVRARQQLRCDAVGRWQGDSACGWQGAGGTSEAHVASPPCSSLVATGFLASGASGDAHGGGWQSWSAGGMVWVATLEVGWPRQLPLAPSSLLFSGGEVNGVSDKSTTIMSVSGRVVAGVCMVDSAAS